PDSIARRITSRTRAILPVHLGGLACDMEAIWALARRHGIFVVEDAAHAAGTCFRGAHVGSACWDGSDAVAFSFYANKNLTTGEGGMLTTNRDELAERIRILTLHGISKDAWNRYAEGGDWFYQVVECGFKYNLSDIQSAIGIHQLRKLEGFVTARTAYAELYNQTLGDVQELELPPNHEYCRHSWHLYIVRLRLESLEIDRNEFIRELRRRGIGASVHFIPIPLHPYFAPYAASPWNQCPRALALYPRLVSLPLYPAMTPEQVGYVAGTVKDIVRVFRKVKAIAAGAGV
ncbi:MAG: DegT/DnrJ/EryC1/StrS family aminotransferase, partial [Acidobacteria bacterium]|nr:DegT/DnrJ/EryC1/StrS family aminotransferase [Acidobacteriota bacterium]